MTTWLLVCPGTFSTVKSAWGCAINDFPKSAATMKAAYYTRVFDARVAKDACRGLGFLYQL